MSCSPAFNTPVPIPCITVTDSKPATYASSRYFSTSIIASSRFNPLRSTSFFTLPDFDLIMFLVDLVTFVETSLRVFCKDLKGRVIFIIPICTTASFLFLSTETTLPF